MENIKNIANSIINTLSKQSSLTDEDLEDLTSNVFLIKKFFIKESNLDDELIIKICSFFNSRLVVEDKNQYALIRLISLRSILLFIIEQISIKNKKTLDLAMNKHYEFFFKLLDYLKKNVTSSEKDLLEELYMIQNDMEDFYSFQQEAGYISRIDLSPLKEDRKYTYYLTYRGMEAHKNICTENQKPQTIEENFKRYQRIRSDKNE